jgi:hypothetical protein
VVERCQAFAWNPSVTGSKVEDTLLVRNGELENITVSPDWPLLDPRHGGAVPVAGVLIL